MGPFRSVSLDQTHKPGVAIQGGDSLNACFVWPPHLQFRQFAIVPLLNRTQVAHDPGIDLGFLIAKGALGLLPVQVPVGMANTEGWGKSEIG